MSDENTSSNIQIDGKKRIFLNRIQGHSSLIIGLLLTIPILFLYLFALDSLVRKDKFLIVSITTIIVFFVGALSLDLEVGSMGLPNFGKVAFFAIGAYISTLLYGEYGVPFYIAVIVALALSCLVGFVVAIPTVKLRADYFAIMTIAGGEVIRLIFQNETRWLWLSTEVAKSQVISNKLRNDFSQASPFDQRLSEFLGNLNISIFEDIGTSIDNILGRPIFEDIGTSIDNIFGPTIFEGIGSFFEELSQLLVIPVIKEIPIIKDILEIIKNLVSLVGSIINDFRYAFLWQVIILLIFIVIALLVYWFVEIIRKSPYGRTLRAIREDDISVTSVGKNVARFRWQVTTLAALIAGIAGVMYAMTFSSFEAGEFKPFLTFNLYMFIIIGGLGNSRGAFAGTALVTMYLHASQTEAVKQAIYLHLGPEDPIFGPLFQILRLDIFINPENTAVVILGVILILFLLFKPAGLIPEPKTDTGKYLSLLTTEERESSDAAVSARQSLSEKERLLEEKEGGTPSNMNRK